MTRAWPRRRVICSKRSGRSVSTLMFSMFMPARGSRPAVKNLLLQVERHTAKAQAGSDSLSARQQSGIAQSQTLALHSQSQGVKMENDLAALGQGEASCM